MNGDTSRQPLLVEFYEAFLNEHDEDAFIAAVAQRYLPATLQRIARCGDRGSRRSAVLALGYLADYESNGVLGKALVDRDRGFRTLAETAIRNVWCRAGTTEQRRILEAIVRHNQSHEHERATGELS